MTINTLGNYIIDAIIASTNIIVLFYMRKQQISKTKRESIQYEVEELKRENAYLRSKIRVDKIKSRRSRHLYI